MVGRIRLSGVNRCDPYSGHSGNDDRKGPVMMPSVDDIIRYEEGDMSFDEMVEFFQGLVDSGMAWQLQGSYGRMAQSLIDEGYVADNGRAE